MLSRPAGTMAKMESPTQSRWGFHSRGPTSAHCNRRAISCQAAGKKIKLICTDVDGTLLNSEQELTEPVLEAITAANNMGIPTMVATGKARGPWIDDVMPKLPPMPGVFMQGLLVHNVDGSILCEQWMEPEIVEQCIEMSEHFDLTLAAYCGTRIVTPVINEHTDRLIFFREPIPEDVGELRDILLGEGAIRTHKCLFMGDPGKLKECRVEVQKRLGEQASITTALSGMLEVLPPGASKCAGMQMVLKRLDISPENVLAMGDAENDIEMLKLAGVSAAMGNASDEVKKVASFVAPTNNEAGVAYAIRKALGLPNLDKAL